MKTKYYLLMFVFLLVVAGCSQYEEEVKDLPINSHVVSGNYIGYWMVGANSVGQVNMNVTDNTIEFRELPGRSWGLLIIYRE